MIVFAHISDLHVDAGRRGADRVRRVMAYLNGLDRLDAILVTGDLADHGTPAEYELVRELLTSPFPVLTGMGNHDTRAAFRQVLRSGAGSGPVNEVYAVGGAQFVLCDSAVPGRSDGYLADETLAWLDGVLASAGGPAFVCLHHPPVPLHQPNLDRIRLFGTGRLAEVLRRHPRVVALLCGHAHTAAATTFAGLPVLVAPGVVNTLRLPWEPGDAVVDLRMPPAVAFHVLDERFRLTTHYRIVT